MYTDSRFKTDLVLQGRLENSRLSASDSTYESLKDRLLRPKGWEDSGPMDSAGSDSVPEVHQRLGRVEHGHRLLGGDVVRREAVLELVESGRDQIDREGIQASSADGLPGGDLSANARLLAEGADPPSDLRQSHPDLGQADPEPGDAQENRPEQVNVSIHHRCEKSVRGTRRVLSVSRKSPRCSRAHRVAPKTARTARLCCIQVRVAVRGPATRVRDKSRCLFIARTIRWSREQRVHRCLCFCSARRPTNRG